MKKERRRVLEIINSCYSDIPEPNLLITKDEFAERSTARWTVKEIEEAIKNSEENPLGVLTLFVDKMEKYALKSKTREQTRIFSIAYDTAVWVENMVSIVFDEP